MADGLYNYGSNQELQPWEYGTNRDVNQGQQYNMTPSYQPATNTGSGSGLFDSFSAAGFSDVVSGVGGLYQMYQGDKFMDMAQKDQDMRQVAYTQARADEDVRMKNNASYGSAFSNA